MSIAIRFAAMLSGVVLVVGCDEVRGDACACEDEVSVRGLVNNTINLNTINLNTINLNTINLNGVSLNGITFGGVSLDDNKLFAADGSGDFIQSMSLNLKGNTAVESVWLEGSQLVAKLPGGQIRSGTELDKAQFQFELQEGGPANKKSKGVLVRGVARLAPDSDVWLYDLDVKTGVGGWQSLCVDQNGVPTEAILIAAVWNPTTAARVSPMPAGSLTFACRGAAIAKCVEWGYKPWSSANGASLADYHQACTRMVRADYCGTGEPHTATGTPIHVLDQVGVQTLDVNANFAIEAEWGPNGAVCVNPNNMRAGAQPLSCQLPSCSAAFSTGGLIQSGKLVGP